MSKQATLYREVTADHICPYGLKAKDLLEHQGFEVIDRHLESKQEAEEFRRLYHVKTTPQTYIDGERVGGYDDLREYFGKAGKADGTTYAPIFAIFGMSFLMALAVAWSPNAVVDWPSVVRNFAGFAMCLLSLQKLQDLEGFSLGFLNYDLLAKSWVRYSYLYPFLEGFVGLAMLASFLPQIAAPISLLIGLVGAVSVVKAVYVEGRELKCACVGGDSNVPLGFISLSENLGMIAMGVWMAGKVLELF